MTYVFAYSSRRPDSSRAWSQIKDSKLKHQKKQNWNRKENICIKTMLMVEKVFVQKAQKSAILSSLHVIFTLTRQLNTETSTVCSTVLDRAGASSSYKVTKLTTAQTYRRHSEVTDNLYWSNLYIQLQNNMYVFMNFL